MIDVPTGASPSSGSAYRVATRVARPGRRPASRSVTRAEWIRSDPLALSQARRAWNRDRIGLVSELRCECTRPRCGDRVPVVAETHRRVDQFVVAPAHLDGGVVARAADRFFIVEAGSRASRQLRAEMTAQVVIRS